MKTLAAERRNGEYNKDELVKRIDQLLEEKNLELVSKIPLLGKNPKFTKEICQFEVL